jgi:endonuclease-3 related protein
MPRPARPDAAPRPETTSAAQTAKRLRRIHDRLFKAFGPQHWWPGETPFEVMVGAILTQNTNWGNVERAIANLKSAGLMSPRRLAACPVDQLAERIRPSGYFNVKARRLKTYLEWLCGDTDGDPLARFRGVPTPALREQLLRIDGVGPETANSILLYALGRRTFVVDAYTRRVVERHGLIGPKASYDEIKCLFERHLPASVKVYNEYHALIVRLGKEFCRPAPRCEDCPIQGM